jgi:hypothetical protein
MVPVTEFEDCKTDKPVKTDTSVSSFTINRSGPKSPFPKNVNHRFYPSDLPNRGETNGNSTEIILMQKFPNVFSDPPTPIDPQSLNISVRINARSTIPLGSVLNSRKNRQIQRMNNISPPSQTLYPKKPTFISTSGMFNIAEADEPTEDPYTILPPGCNAIDK